MNQGVFVVGTDTGVGKTTASLVVMHGLRARGLKVAGMKPCETGEGTDAERLRAASSIPLETRDQNPYRFPLPAAPSIAARDAGQSIDLSTIVAAQARVASQADFTLVEGAGGLLVPFTERETTVDLITALRFPIVIVARTALGTINHSLLTIEVARARGLEIRGLVFSHGSRGSRGDSGADPHEEEVLASIERLGGVRRLGVLPWLSPEVQGSPAQLAAIAEAHLSLDAFIA